MSGGVDTHWSGLLPVRSGETFSEKEEILNPFLVPMRISVSQEQAERVCRGLGGHLAEIETREEQEALSSHYRRETGAVEGGGGNLVNSIIHRLASLARRQSAWWTGGRYSEGGWTWPLSGQKWVVIMKEK